MRASSLAGFGARPITGQTPILDIYTANADGAFSNRLLRSAYTGDCMEVRRTSDDALADIGFDANGDLDTAAITSHCGASDGHVRTWYDQSGNGYDAPQTTNANQPQIYDNATYGIRTNEHGNPSIFFDGSSHHFDHIGVNTIKSEADACWLIVFHSVSGTQDTIGQLFGTASASNGFIHTYGAGFFVKDSKLQAKLVNNSSGVVLTPTATIAADTTYVAVANIDDDSTSELWIDGAQVATDTDTPNDFTSYTTNNFMGGRASDTFMNGHLHEAIFWRQEYPDDLAAISQHAEDYWQS